MDDRERMLEEGPRAAPEPETAEARSTRLGKRGLAGGVVAGGAVAAKFGVLKAFVWFFAIRSAFDLAHVGAWVAIALLITVVGVALALRARAEG